MLEAKNHSEILALASNPLRWAADRSTHWDGETRAQVVWQASCWLEQLLRHAPLAVALVPDKAPLDDEEEGTTQVAWQFAAWELQSIMQLVVVELCARRVDLLALAANALAADTPIANAVKTMRKPRTSASSVVRTGQHNALAAAAKCTRLRGGHAALQFKREVPVATGRATASRCETLRYAVRM